MSIVFQKILRYEFSIIMEFFILDGYGQYVWPAFIFTFISFFTLYLKVKKDFKKQEKIFFSNFKQLKTIKIKNIKRQEIRKKSLSGNLV
mgnify:CR=1 FL=1